MFNADSIANFLSYGLSKSVLYVDSISLNVRGFYYSTDKIIRIMFIVIVSVIHCCWLCSSTNHNSARCHLPTAPPPPSVYSVTLSWEYICYYCALALQYIVSSGRNFATHESTVDVFLVQK